MGYHHKCRKSHKPRKTCKCSRCNHKKKNKGQVNMDLIVDVPNSLSITMDIELARGWIPPDPIVGASKETVVVMVNSLISIYDKKTLQRTTEPIDGFRFFGLSEDNFLLGDPWIAYDAYDDRVWLSGFSFPDDVEEAQMNFAVSKNGSPRTSDDFYFYKQKFNFKFPDYPKIAVDGKALYMGTNDEVAPEYDVVENTIRIYDKAPLLDGTSPSEISPIHTEIYSSHQADIPSEEYPVSNWWYIPWPAQQTLRSRCDDVNQMVIAQIVTPDPGKDTGGNQVGISFFKNVLTDPTLVEVIVEIPEWNNFGPHKAGFGEPAAEQPEPWKSNPPPCQCDQDPKPLEPLDSTTGQLFNPVLYKDSLYFSHIVASDDGERWNLRWYQFDVSRLIDYEEASLVQYGTLDQKQYDYLYSSINVDKHQNVAVGFSYSGPYDYVGPAYTGRLKNDPEGTLRLPFRSVADNNLYYQIAPGGRNRYGDYSGLAIDPCDGETFWYFNQYTYEFPSTISHFGSAWNTKLTAFKIKPCGGTMINNPQIISDKPKSKSVKSLKTIGIKTENTIEKSDIKISRKERWINKHLGE